MGWAQNQADFFRPPGGRHFPSWGCSLACLAASYVEWPARAILSICGAASCRRGRNCCIPKFPMMGRSHPARVLESNRGNGTLTLGCNARAIIAKFPEVIGASWASIGTLSVAIWIAPSRDGSGAVHLVFRRPRAWTPRPKNPQMRINPSRLPVLLVAFSPQECWGESALSGTEGIE